MPTYNYGAGGGGYSNQYGAGSGGSGGSGGSYIATNSISLPLSKPNSILSADEKGNLCWISVEDALGDLLRNPTIRDRIENAIKALKNLEMTMKLIKE